MGECWTKFTSPGTSAITTCQITTTAADLYMSASHTDGSSVSLMEAMACGLPCAVSSIAGNQEWVQTGEQGWVFPDGDAEKLAEIMLAASRLTGGTGGDESPMPGIKLNKMPIGNKTNSVCWSGTGLR